MLLGSGCMGDNLERAGSHILNKCGQQGKKKRKEESTINLTPAVFPSTLNFAIKNWSWQTRRVTGTTESFEYERHHLVCLCCSTDGHFYT